MAAGAWRLLLDPPARAAWNMAVDEALLLGGSPRPVLRLYCWEPAALSLGYRQTPPPWLDRCTELGLEVVRRVTGGGAVLHAGDLTYAVMAPAGAPDLPAGIRPSYEWIRTRLLDGLKRAGLDAEPSRPGGCADRAPLCFAGATGLEIDLAGAKLVGSAQRRTRWGLLQHGSVRLADDRPLYRALAGSEPACPPLPAVDVADVARALEASFRSALGGRIEPSALTPMELAIARDRASARRSDSLAGPALSSRRLGACADRLP